MDITNTSSIFNKYKTPFASLVAKKECPVDQELMNGNWKFCPFHGELLIEVNK